MLNVSRIVMLSAAIFFLNGCAKEEGIKKATSIVQSDQLEATLYDSQEYSDYVVATRAVIQSIDWSRIAEARPEKANTLINKETFTRSEAAAILGHLPINQEQYFKNENIRLQSIKSFQAKYNLTDEQSTALWHKVSKEHQEEFTRDIITDPIEALFCVIDAVNIFIETSEFCLTLREIPFIGEELYQACQLGAITLLITTVQECIGISIFP